MYDLLIIGAGASGLMAGITAARKGRNVLILEHNKKPGRKILATGNGKCNFTNLNVFEDSFRSDNMNFPKKVIDLFDIKTTVDFFDKLGIYYKNKDGYLYPYSEQSSSLVKALILECERLNIDIKYEIHINEILKPNFTLIINGEKHHFKKLLLATGGCASKKLGSDGSGYKIAREFGHNIIKPLPALVQLVSFDKFCNDLSGVRVNAHIGLFEDGELIKTEEGEIQFTNYGLSGIPVLQVSRYATKALDKGKEVKIRLNFMNELEKKELFNIIKARIYNSANKDAYHMLIGLFNEKLINVLLNRARIPRNLISSKISENQINNLLNQIRNFSISIKDHNSFDNAQVTAGGVDTNEINPKTMESKIVKGLYFAGEIVDVDGTCGGYNLQWAWSSGYIAGSNC